MNHKHLAIKQFAVGMILMIGLNVLLVQRDSQQNESYDAIRALQSRPSPEIQ